MARRHDTARWLHMEAIERIEEVGLSSPDRPAINSHKAGVQRDCEVDALKRPSPDIEKR